MPKMVYAEFKQAAWNTEKLCSLGLAEEWLAERHPTPDQMVDLLKGILYLRDMYPRFWSRNNDLEESAGFRSIL
jgi:hypothetical protein